MTGRGDQPGGVRGEHRATCPGPPAYAVAYRLVGNILVLWPLLTPLGAFFNNLQAGDINLPWASIAEFADVLIAIGVVWWLAWRHEHEHRRQPRRPALRHA